MSDTLLIIEIIISTIGMIIALIKLMITLIEKISAKK